jgi:hypothetical protein
MLPENQKELEFYVSSVKRNMDDLLDYMRQGSHDDYRAGRGKLYYLSDLMLYLIDLLSSDEAGRVAESYREWLQRKLEESRQARQSGMFSK